MRIRRVAVVLNGSGHDKETFQAAVRMAARDGAEVRVVLGAACSREAYEKHLHFALWDVRERLRMPSPSVVLEAYVPDPVEQEAGRTAWTCA